MMSMEVSEGRGMGEEVVSGGEEVEREQWQILARGRGTFGK